MCLDKIERANFLRFLCFFIDIGTDTLLQLFLHFVHQEDVVAFFSSDDVRKKCQELCSRNVLSKKQLSIINHSCPDIFSFDISLLIALLSNLFSGKIKPPIGGWETNNPHRNDIEVAADIVRLRLLRNEVVGHSSRAKLSEGYFQELWERLETIILRLYSFLKPNSKCDISKQIDSYKTMNLDEQRERQYQEKLKTLQDACIEIVQIQDKVDDLLRKCQDFAQFFSTKRKRFSLYIKLLLDGGRLVLTAYLQRELSKRNITIQEVIVEKRAVLEKYSGDTETIQHLNEAVDKWVIGYLATVILVCFEDTVTPRIKEAITGIKDAFLGYARLALVSLNDDKFSDIYVDLVNNLRRLSLDLGSDIESKCEEFIDTYRRKKQENEPDTDDDFDLFKSHGLKMKELEDVYKETLIHLKKVITEMEERGIPFKKDYVLQLQLMTYGEKKMFVEDILVAVITAILRHDESTSGSKDIWEALHLLLDQINNISGVKVESVERHCILISITCSSSLGLLKLIEYVESTLFQELLYKLSTDLMALFGEVLVVTGNFNFESLHDLSNCLSSCFDTEHEPGGLTLHVTCSSVEGINQVVRLMKTDTTKHTVKQIAQHLSEQVQENVSLQIGFPDLQDFFREVGNNGTNLSSSQRETAQSDPFSTKDGKDTTNPGKKSEEFGLQQENFVTTTKTEAEVCRASLASITQTTNELLSIQEQANIDVVLKNIYMRQGEVVKIVQDPADTCSSQLKRGDSELHGTDNTLELEIKSLDKGNVSVEEGKRIFLPGRKEKLNLLSTLPARTGYLGDEGYTPGERRRATMSYTATRAREMNNSRQVQPPFVGFETVNCSAIAMTATFKNELAYLGQGVSARRICAGKFLKGNKIAFVDRKNSVLLITDPSSNTKQEIDLKQLLVTVGVENLNEDRTEPSDVNEAWNEDQLLVTFTRRESSLGIVCHVKFDGETVSLQPPYHVLKFNERSRSIIAINGSHFCARTKNRIVILTMQGDVIANHPLRGDRGGLLMTDRKRNLFFGDKHEFVGCTWDGGNNIREMFRFTDPNMKFPRGSSFDGKGNIVVACDSSENIFQLTGEGNLLRILEIERGNQFGDIDFHQDGCTFFTTFWTNNKWPRLYILDF